MCVATWSTLFHYSETNIFFFFFFRFNSLPFIQSSNRTFLFKMCKENWFFVAFFEWNIKWFFNLAAKIHSLSDANKITKCAYLFSVRLRLKFIGVLKKWKKMSSFYQTDIWTTNMNIEHCTLNTELGFIPLSHRKTKNCLFYHMFRRHWR